MGYVGVFLSQALVLLLMLLGMGVGDVAASSLFGRIKGNLKQLLYLLLFVVFLVSGNYLPTLLRIPNPSLYTAAMLFSLWGFLSVFMSRFILSLMHYVVRAVRGILSWRRAGMRGTRVERKELTSFLRGRLDGGGVEEVMADAVLSCRGGVAYINSGKLCRVLDGKGVSRRDVLFMLVEILRLSPEKSVFIYYMNTTPSRDEVQ